MCLLCEAKKNQQPVKVPGEPTFTKAMLPMFVTGRAAALRSSAMPVVCSPELVVGRDAIKLGSLMDLILFWTRSQNNISQMPVLNFQEYCGQNYCKDWWDWSDIQKIPAWSWIIEHGVPGYDIDGLPTRILFNLYSQKKSMMDCQRQGSISVKITIPCSVSRSERNPLAEGGADSLEVRILQYQGIYIHLLFP